MHSLKNLLATNLVDRVKSLQTQDNSTVICEVLDWDINYCAFKGKAPDGSIRYFRFIGNASLPLGSKVSVVLPVGALIGWADTEAR